MASNSTKQRPTLLYNSVDVEGDQENEDDEMMMEPLDINELPPDEPSQNQSKSSSDKKAIMKPIIITPEDIKVMYDHARCLSYAQKVVFDMVIHYIRCVAIASKGGLIKPEPPMILVNGRYLI